MRHIMAFILALLVFEFEGFIIDTGRQKWKIIGKRKNGSDKRSEWVSLFVSFEKNRWNLFWRGSVNIVCRKYSLENWKSSWRMWGWRPSVGRNSVCDIVIVCVQVRERERRKRVKRRTYNKCVCECVREWERGTLNKCVFSISIRENGEKENDTICVSFCGASIDQWVRKRAHMSSLIEIKWFDVCVCVCVCVGVFWSKREWMWQSKSAGVSAASVCVCVFVIDRIKRRGSWDGEIRPFSRGAKNCPIDFYRTFGYFLCRRNLIATDCNWLQLIWKCKSLWVLRRI